MMGKEIWFWLTIAAVAIIAVSGVKLAAGQSWAPSGLQKLGSFL